jgi:hypothetical protein
VPLDIVLLTQPFALLLGKNVALNMKEEGVAVKEDVYGLLALLLELLDIALLQESLPLLILMFARKKVRNVD